MSKATIVSTLKKLDDILVEAINEHSLPGLAVGVVHESELLYAKGFGHASIEDDVAVTPDTIFRIGSISKTHTAFGIMQLWEQGKLDLDDPVNDHLKAYKVLHKDPNAPPVTIRHMLTHTSGIGEIRDLTDLLKPVLGLGAKPEDPVVPLGEYYNGLLMPEIYPGEKVAYANHAWATLGQVIEDISGQPFAEYMIEHVFEPLGMHHSDYLLSERVKDKFANAYSFKKGMFKPVDYLRIEVAGAGSIFSSLNDMAKYVAALMNDGENERGRLVKPETFEQMLVPQLDVDSRLGTNRGLYFVLARYGEHRIIWHNGGWPGFSSAMYVAPDDKLGILVFTNTSSDAPDLIAMDVLRRMLDVPDPVTQVPVPGVLETPHDWPKLCGFYGPKPGLLTNFRIWGGFGGELEVFTRGTHLTVRSLIGGMKKGVTLHRVDADDPMIYKGVNGKIVTTVIFKSDEHGQVTSLQIGTNEFYKRPFQQSVKFKAFTIIGSLAGLILLGIGKKLFKKK